MSLRFRFVVAKETGTVQEASRSFASALARRVGFNAAENSYKLVRDEISRSFQQDAKQELVHLAALYRRHIIGASGSRRRPSGMLSYRLGPSDSGVGDDDREIAIAASLPEWAPRSPEYLKHKRQQLGSISWFSYQGVLARGLTADTLLAAYGPVRVTVIRDIRATEEGRSGRSFSNLGGRLKTFGPNAGPAASMSPADQAAARVQLHVATIRVYAMEQITLSMLPALASGDPTAMNSDEPARGRRFLAPLRGVAPELANRLGTLSYQTGLYRPTLEPFLAWYLTRSIPNALALRIEEGAVRRATRRNVVRR